MGSDVQKREAALRAHLGLEMHLALTASQAHWVDPDNEAKRTAHLVELRPLIQECAKRFAKHPDDVETLVQDILLDVLAHVAAGRRQTVAHGLAHDVLQDDSEPEKNWFDGDWYPLERRVRHVAPFKAADLAKSWNGQASAHRAEVNGYFDRLQAELTVIYSHCVAGPPHADVCNALCLLMVMAVAKFHDHCVLRLEAWDRERNRDTEPRAWVVRDYLAPFSYRIQRLFANEITMEADRPARQGLEAFATFHRTVELFLDKLKAEALQTLPGVRLVREDDLAHPPEDVQASTPLQVSDTFQRVKNLLNLVEEAIADMDRRPVRTADGRTLILYPRHQDVWRKYLAFTRVRFTDVKGQQHEQTVLDASLLSAAKLGRAKTQALEEHFYTPSVGEFETLTGYSENTLRKLTDEAYEYVKHHPRFDAIVFHFVPTKWASESLEGYLAVTEKPLPAERGEDTVQDKYLASARKTLVSKNGKKMFRDAVHVWGVDKQLIVE